MGQKVPEKSSGLRKYTTSLAPPLLSSSPFFPCEPSMNLQEKLINDNS